MKNIKLSTNAHGMEAVWTLTSLTRKRSLPVPGIWYTVGVLTSIDRSSSTFLFSAQQHDFLFTDSYESGYTDLARGVGLSIRRCNTVSGRLSGVL